MTLKKQYVRIDATKIVWVKDLCVSDYIEMSKGCDSELECVKKEIESIKKASAEWDRLRGMP